VQFVAALVVPAAFGALVGVMLGVSAAAYWGLQGLAAVGGLVFGSFLLLAHAITDAEPKADLGELPGLLIVFAGIFGALLGALGGALRQRRSRKRA
jgi:hypothetical protein